jgi:enoyl-CoA hydratase/carnithine racemase
MTMDYKTLLYTLDDDGIATITLNRPDVLNAVNMEMRHDFTALMDELFFNEAVRVVVFTGAGRGFSAGGDMSHFEHDWITPTFRANSRRLTKFFDDLEALEKPVIAAINGTTTGAGLELALACDIRIASAEATLGFRENYIGLIPGVGGCARLIRAIGVHRAKELIWMGTMVSADEAYEMGMLNRVVPHEQLMDVTYDLARTLLKRAPQSIGLAKKILNTIANLDQTSGIVVEGLAQSILLKTEDHREGVQAFREKRRPTFRGR